MLQTQKIHWLLLVLFSISFVILIQSKVFAQTLSQDQDCSLKCKNVYGFNTGYSLVNRTCPTTGRIASGGFGYKCCCVNAFCANTQPSCISTNYRYKCPSSQTPCCKGLYSNQIYLPGCVQSNICTIGQADCILVTPKAKSTLRKLETTESESYSNSEPDSESDSESDPGSDSE